MKDSRNKQIRELILTGMKDDKPEILFSAVASTLLEIEERLSEISTEIARRGQW